VGAAVRATKMRSSPSFSLQKESISHDGDTDKGMDACQDEGRSIPSSTSSWAMAQVLMDQGRLPMEIPVVRRRWMVENGKSLGDRTDNDAIRKELERLNISEAQASRDIRAAMQLFQEATGKNELSQMETDLVFRYVGKRNSRFFCFISSL
jgi:hypothetical protein